MLANGAYEKTELINRDNRYDLTRTFAMFMVMVNHVADYYLLKTEYMVLELFLIEGLAHCAIPIFLLLTGTFVVEKQSTIEAKHFYKRAAVKIFLPAVVFSFLYCLFDLSITHTKNILDIVKTLWHGCLKVYPTWYMFMLAGVYALIPLIYKLKVNMTKKSYKRFVILFFIWAMISKHFDAYISSWSIGCVTGFLGFVIFGDYLKENKKRKTNRQGILFILLGITILFADYYFLYCLVQQGKVLYNYSWLNNYAAPLPCLASILIFFGLSSLEIKYSFRRISSLSFFIYLCHKPILDVLHIIWFDKLGHSIPKNFTPVVVVEVLVLTVICVPLSIC